MLRLMHTPLQRSSGHAPVAFVLSGGCNLGAVQVGMLRALLEHGEVRVGGGGAHQRRLEVLRAKLRAILEELEGLGLTYFDDFFELSGNLPIWLPLYASSENGD
jgi:hypothetical protein